MPDLNDARITLTRDDAGSLLHGPPCSRSSGGVFANESRSRCWQSSRASVTSGWPQIDDLAIAGKGVHGVAEIVQELDHAGCDDGKRRIVAVVGAVDDFARRQPVDRVRR